MADQNTASSKPSRLWQIVLVISLALNLAIAGLVVGVTASGRLGDRPPHRFELNLGPMSRALAPQERRAIGRVLRGDPALRGLDLRGRADLMVSALEADPFDPGVFRDIMAEQNSRMQALQGAAQEALIDQITAMTPQRRAAFAEQLREELSRARPLRDRASGG